MVRKPTPVDSPFSMPTPDQLKYEKPITPGNSFHLSEKELDECITKAQSGDPKSAAKLYSYYNFSTCNFEKAKYWLKTAAELGDVKSQLNHAMHLENESKLSDAISWTKKAEKSGSSRASKLLKSLEHKQRKT